MTSRGGRITCEADLYEPVRQFLIAQGYEVYGEVNDCDVTGVKGDDIVIVELKRRLNLALLLQAIERQNITNSVYVAIPRPKAGSGCADWRKKRRLLRRLELGLLFVSPRSARKVEVILHPAPYEQRLSKHRRRRLLREVNGRSGDYNRGGTRGKKMTAYRENCLHIACCLEQNGPLSPRKLRELGTGPKTQSILYNNHYGWFERIAYGTYALSHRGQKALEEYHEVADFYRQQIEPDGRQDAYESK